MDSNRKWIAVVAGVAILAVLFFLLKPKGETTPSVPKDTKVVVEVKDGTVTGPKAVTATQGGQVSITVTSDVADEIHVHGYDLKKDLEPNVPGTISFTADAAGEFEVELENEGQLMFTLTVQP